MHRGKSGENILISTISEVVEAFVPHPLPPTPEIHWSESLRLKFEQANSLLAQLDMASEFTPNTELFLYSYIRKEAVLSSMIEGTVSTLADLMLFELDEFHGVLIDDAQEVSSYVRALNHGIDLLDSGIPLSSRLLKRVHGELLGQGRGSDQLPGEFRRSQNWLGGSRPGNALFVPPPADKVLSCMGDLDNFINDAASTTPPLLKAALAHVQCETIHPFLDGNGRVGRMLITLILLDQQVLKAPTLYLSLYFKEHRDEYYRLLTQVRTNGDWEAWLEFFSTAVISTATEAIGVLKKLSQLSNSDRQKISGLKRASVSADKVHQLLLQRPVVNAKFVGTETGLSHPTVNTSLKHLVDLGILVELTGFKRNRVFIYSALVEILMGTSDKTPSL